MSMSGGTAASELADRLSPLASLRRYGSVLAAFAKNSLVRDMTFRANFFFECISSVSWTLMNLGLYVIVYRFTPSIGPDSGWGQWQFFAFLATTWIVHSVVETLFMSNAEQFSEHIRTGSLDFVLLKPIDPQFLVSFQRIDWSGLANLVTGVALLLFSLNKLGLADHLQAGTVLLYGLYVACGVAILYSVMIALAASSVWLGRNQTLYDFWFYITNFSRYPMEIYQRGWGWSLWGIFTFIFPVLLVINVPARIIARPLDPRAWWEWPLAGFALIAAVAALCASRWLFLRALNAYRSASS
jgi:ABC-2 type transport system permease protein